MLALYALLFLGLVAAMCAQLPARRAAEVGPRALNVRAFLPLATGMVLTTWWHVHVIGTAALLQHPLPPSLAALPAIPVLDVAPLFGHIDVRISELVEWLSLLETALLGALVFIARGCRLGRGGAIVMLAGSAALTVIVLRAHGILSGDVYAYIADGALGTQAYHPTAAPLGRGLWVITKLWGNPPLPCTYGPAWLYPATLLMHGVHDVSAGVLRFRWAGIGSILAVAACLLRARAPLPVILAFTLNPTVWLQYGADAHNDLWPVALILCGRLFANRPVVAALFGGLAGAAKLPFLAVCILTGANRQSVRERVLIGAGSVAVALVVSAVFGGRPYLDALVTVRRVYATAPDPQSLGVQILALAGTLTALGWAVAARRIAWPAAFSFMGIGYGAFPWYAAWGLSYATLGDGAESLLCALPVVAFVTATTYPVTPLWLPLLWGVAICACLYAYAFARRRFVRVVPAAGKPSAAAPASSVLRLQQTEGVSGSA